MCVFCDIVKKHVPANIVAEDILGGCIAIMDIKPINRGHVIVMPYAHAPNLSDLTSHEELHLTKLAIKIAKAMRATLGCSAVNIICNDGKDAGQEIPHTHFHIVPRYPDDGFRFKVNKGHHVPTGTELADDAAALKKAIDAM